jgi:hypothetical protein
MYTAKTAGKRQFALSELGDSDGEPGGYGAARLRYDAAVAG